MLRPWALTAGIVVFYATLAGQVHAQATPESPPLPTTPEKQLYDELDRLWGEVEKFSGENKLLEAIAAETKALAVERKLYGSAHDTIVDSLGNIGNMQVERKDFAAARAAYLEALAISIKLHGPTYWKSIDYRIYAADVDLYEMLTPEQFDAWMECEERVNEISQLCEQSKFAEALPKAEALVESCATAVGEAHREYSTALILVATILQELGKSTEAISTWRRAVTIDEQVLGRKHPDTVSDLNSLIGVLEALVDQQLAANDLEGARKARVEIRNLQIRFYGAKHWKASDAERAIAELETLKKLTADERKELAEAQQAGWKVVELSNAQNYEEAKALAQDVLSVRERILGPGDGGIAAACANLAYLHQELGDYASAEPLYLRALAIREQTVGPEHPYTATVLNNLAGLRKAKGDYVEAKQLFERALAIREKALEPEDRDLATSLNNLATLHKEMGDYAAASPLFVRALEIYEVSSGPEHLDTALVLNNLANLNSTVGNYDEAWRLYLRAVEIQEKALGPDHFDVVMTYCNMASLCVERGEFNGAEGIFRWALMVVEQKFGAEHPITATIADKLGSFYQSINDYGAAEPLYQRGLVVREKTLGPDHPDIASSLNNLAVLWGKNEQYAAAEPYFQRALKIRRRTLGPEHILTADSLNNLGWIYGKQRNYAAAEPLYRQALEIYQKVLGHDHHVVATCLNNLGMLLKDQEKLAEAGALLLEATEIYNKTVGFRAPDAAACLHNLCYVYALQGRAEEVATVLQFAVTNARQSLELAADGLSERRQITMSESLRPHLDTYILLTDVIGGDPTAVYAEVLAWKGAVQARQRLTRLARVTKNPEILKTLDALQSLSDQLATLALAKPPLDQRAAWQRQLASLSELKQAAEANLSGLSADFRRQRAAKTLTVADLQAALPVDTALVDLLEYQGETVLKEVKMFRSERHLAAFVVRRDRPVVLVDLGPIAPIAAAVDAWRRNFAVPEGSGRITPGAELRRVVWEPLARHLAGASLVLVSPDGPLTRFPLAALPGSKPNKFLMEETALAVVPVPQLLPELLREQPERAADATSLLALGAVDFGAMSDAATPPAPSLLHAASVPQVAMRTAPRIRPDDERLKWGALPGTKQELDALQVTFREAFRDGKIDLLTADRATEQTLRDGAPRHRFLHLATHGFFAPAEIRSALAPSNEPDRQRRGSDPFGEQGLIGFHPGLLSGIVLAGANQPPQPDRDDGILTALEVAELDLSQVDLAVLSACETGLGQAAGGEGVLGLQRAFQTAGARTTVTSLWKVDDAATRTLMTEFYKNLWERKLGKLEALRQAQLTMLRSYDAHDGVLRGTVAKLKPQITPGEANRQEKPAAGLSPYYWAAFVLAGDWR